MNYKNFLLIVTILFLNNCSTDTFNNNNVSYDFHHKFSSKGFALIYTDDFFKNKIISKKIDQRSLLIFQKNLKKGTTVKITNLLNNKSLIANVAGNSIYPNFNNSVITSRIAVMLELNSKEPYIEITSIPKNSMFIAKNSKIFDEEKKIASKAPVDSISINDINQKKKVEVKVENVFSYIIKIADFYFENTAILMSKRISNETNIKNPKILRLSDNKHRLYLGVFADINSLQKSFNDINIFEFENIEIIKND